MMVRLLHRFAAPRLVLLAALAASCGCAIHPVGWLPVDGGSSCGCGDAIGCDDGGACCDAVSNATCADEVAVGCSDSHCRLYSPEAGIFNFCMPPASLGALPPPPPGRFFPVPVRPVFAPRHGPIPPPPGW